MVDEQERQIKEMKNRLKKAVFLVEEECRLRVEELQREYQKEVSKIEQKYEFMLRARRQMEERALREIKEYEDSLRQEERVGALVE